MASMVPRGASRGFLKWLNGHSIVGSAREPPGSTHGEAAHVAILRAARYVNASRDARGRVASADDRDDPITNMRALTAPSDRALAWVSRPCGRRPALRRPRPGSWWLYRRAIPE